MAVQINIVEWIQSIANVASSAQRKISYLLVVGLAASAYLAWELYTPAGALWWNIIKCGLVLLPGLIWVFVWSVLNQLKEAPELVANLVQQEDGVFNNLASLNLKQPDGLRSVFSSLREFRKEEGFGIVFETISGVALLANPFFAVFALATALGLLSLIVIVPFVLIF